VKPNIQAVALRLLARREHSAQELRRKLGDKGFTAGEVENVLERLAQDKLLSDERFVESFIQSRINKGYGPLHIQAELYERGISRGLIDALIQTGAAQWSELAVRAQHKRFGQGLPADYKEYARQARFLQQRGFTMEQINSALKQAHDAS